MDLFYMPKKNIKPIAEDSLTSKNLYSWLIRKFWVLKIVGSSPTFFKKMFRLLVILRFLISQGGVAVNSSVS